MTSKALVFSRAVSRPPLADRVERTVRKTLAVLWLFSDLALLCLRTVKNTFKVLQLQCWTQCICGHWMLFPRTPDSCLSLMLAGVWKSWGRWSRPRPLYFLTVCIKSVWASLPFLSLNCRNFVYSTSTTLILPGTSWPGRSRFGSMGDSFLAPVYAC